jgi:hypothetical protein
MGHLIILVVVLAAVWLAFRLARSRARRDG